MQFDHRTSYRAALALSVLTTLALVWLSLGVGLIGADGDPANRMYFAVVAIGLVGSAVVRLRARRMAGVLFAMAAAQAIVCTIALVGRLGLPYSGPLELVLLNGFFVVMFGVCGWMFRRAAARTEVH